MDHFGVLETEQRTNKWAPPPDSQEETNLSGAFVNFNEKDLFDPLI
ncbi:MAG: hypothetical protein ACI86M_000766 [Saprospiraceae bacterium]|jgi:hypothetical protein